MKNILIIDDNKDILRALQIGLSGLLKDVNILTAVNGETGSQIMRSQPVDLVIADLDMPVMNGYQFVERVWKEFASIPVCVMTGHCSDDARERLKGFGVKRIIGKPFAFESLSDIIAEELGLRKHGAV